MAQQYIRKVIRDVFVNMLNEHPLIKITVKDIVTACEINRNTFYYNYSDLYEILAEIFQIELQRVIVEYNETLSWEESFLLAMEFALKNKKAIYHVYNSIQRDALEQYVFGVAGSIMERYVETVSHDIPAYTEEKLLIASFYQSALTGMVFHWISTGMNQEPEQVIRRIGLLFDENIALSFQRSAKLNDTW